MGEKKNICFFIGSMDRGGAERVISILANYYAEKEYDVQIVMLLSNKCGYKLNDNIKLIDLSGNCVSRVKRIPYWLRSINECLIKFNPDYIVTFAARIGILVTIAGYKWRDRIIISERSDPKHDNRGFLGRLLVPILYPKVKRIVFQTQRVKRLFPKGIQMLSDVIGNPVEVSCQAVDFAKRKPKIVSVGRLIELKNHAMLIHAFAGIVKDHPEYKLYIYGEGEMRSKLEKQIFELGLKNKVFLPGNIKNVHKEMADASIFVLPSNYEGLSNALLEAMMMGLPCVSTNCLGSDEAIKDGENGLIIDIDDGIALEKALIKLIVNNRLRENMGNMAKSTSVIFKTKNIIRQWEKTIER